MSIEAEIEAGALAIFARTYGPNAVWAEAFDDYREASRDDAAAVIAAVEPLLRERLAQEVALPWAHPGELANHLLRVFEEATEQGVAADPWSEMASVVWPHLTARIVRGDAS